MTATGGLNLQGELMPLEDAFLAAEQEYGVSAVFLAAVAALESGWGSSDLAREKHNLFGWRSGDGGYMTFDSPEACIDHVARAIAANYLDPEGSCYHGQSVAGVAVSYCGGNPEWVASIEGLMGEISTCSS